MTSRSGVVPPPPLVWSPCMRRALPYLLVAVLGALSALLYTWLTR